MVISMELLQVLIMRVLITCISCPISLFLSICHVSLYYDVYGFFLVMIVAYLFTLLVSGFIAYLFNQKYLKIIIGKF